MELTAALVALDQGVDPTASLCDLFAAGVDLDGSAVAIRPGAPAALRHRLAGLGPSLVEAADTLPWPTAAWLAMRAAGTDVVLALDVGDVLDARWLAQARRVIRDGNAVAVSVSRSTVSAPPQLGPIVLVKEAAAAIGGLDTGLRSRGEALQNLLGRARAAGLGISCLPSTGAVADEAWDVALELDQRPRHAGAPGQLVGTALLVATHPLHLFGPLASAASEVLRDSGYRVMLSTPDPPREDALVERVDDLAEDLRAFVDVVVCFDASAMLRTRPSILRSNPMTAFVLVAERQGDDEAEMERAMRSADVVASIGSDLATIDRIPLRPAIAVMSQSDGVTAGRQAWRSVFDQALDHRRRVLGYGAS